MEANRAKNVSVSPEAAYLTFVFILAIVAAALLEGSARLAGFVTVFLIAYFSPRPKISLGAKLPVIALAILFVAGLQIHEISARRRDKRQIAMAAEEQNRELVERQAKAEHVFESMTPAEHLAAAKRLLTPNATNSALNQAEYQLNAIPADSPQSHSVVELRSQIAALIRSRAVESQKLNDHALETARVAFAKTVENQMLEQGWDFDVVATGASHMTLRMTWPLASKVAVHQISQNTQMFETARELGFRRMELTDGYDQTWSWKLQ